MSFPFAIRAATVEDVPTILAFIRALAVYEKLEDECVVDEEGLRASLFGQRPCAEVLLGFESAAPAVFAVFFQNFSTFLGKPGIYLEDLFVHPEFRRRGYGRAMLTHLARLANQRGCGRFEWSVLDWNQPAIDVYTAFGAEVLQEWRICRLAGPTLERFGR